MNLFSSFFLIWIAFFGASLRADDNQPTVRYTYTGEVAGVVCNVCSEHVRTALKKLPGVTSVKITMGKEGSLPRLVVVSTSPDLTKEAAIKALGEHAKNYTIVSLSK